MNIDTDTQWAYWTGIRDFYKAKEGYLQAQIGNPEGEDKPNKKYYDPRVSSSCLIFMLEVADAMVFVGIGLHQGGGEDYDC